MHLSLPYHEGRPSVTLKIKNKDNQKYFTALIDSGADFSIFPIHSAIVLDINIKKLKKIKVESADGDSFEVYKTILEAEMDGEKFFLPIGFSNKTNTTPLIGREGFFETFKIEFDHRSKVVNLKNY